MIIKGILYGTLYSTLNLWSSMYNQMKVQPDDVDCIPIWCTIYYWPHVSVFPAQGPHKRATSLARTTSPAAKSALALAQLAQELVEKRRRFVGPKNEVVRLWVNRLLLKIAIYSGCSHRKLWFHQKTTWRTIHIHIYIDIYIYLQIMYQTLWSFVT